MDLRERTRAVRAALRGMVDHEGLGRANNPHTRSRRPSPDQEAAAAPVWRRNGSGSPDPAQPRPTGGRWDHPWRERWWARHFIPCDFRARTATRALVKAATHSGAEPKASVEIPSRRVSSAHPKRSSRSLVYHQPPRRPLTGLRTLLQPGKSEGHLSVLATGHSNRGLDT